MTTTEDRRIVDATTSRRRLMCLLLAGIGMYAGALLAAPGDLDPGFGDHGRVQLPFDGGLDDWILAIKGPAIVWQPDGRVLVARTDGVGGDWKDSEVAVARLRTDGTPDPEFGTGGIVRLRFREGEAAGVGGLALLPDGRLVVVGYSVTAWVEGGMGDYPTYHSGLALIRADGSLDPDGFGGGGRTVLALSEAGQSDHAGAVVALEDGHIVVAGTAQNDRSTRFFMMRMTLQGALDPSFGDGDGFTWTSSIAQLRGFHRLADGRFVACGNWFGGSAPESRIVRFDSAGDLVGTTYLTSAGFESLTACAPQEDGSVLIGGAGSLGRVDVDGQLDLAFGEDWGRTSIFCRSCTTWDQLGYERIPTGIAVLADGRLAVALDGYGWGQPAILSFAPNGLPDTSSTASSADRFFEVGWRDLPPTAGASRLLSTTEGELLAVVAGSQSTTVLRLNASGGPGASVIGLQGDFTQQSESDSRGLVVCRSGSNEGMVSVNYASRDDTALSPDDYVPVSGVLTWGDGEAGCRVIQITVKVDSQAESTESIWVELTDAVGAGLAMDKARLYVVDGIPPGAAPAPTPSPPPTGGGSSTRGGGGAAGSALLMMLAAFACLRRFAR